VKVGVIVNVVVAVQFGVFVGVAPDFNIKWKAECAGTEYENEFPDKTGAVLWVIVESVPPKAHAVPVV
jgi:hypothetical protein